MRALLSLSRKRRAFVLKIGALVGVDVALFVAGTPIHHVLDRIHDAWWTGYEGWEDASVAHVFTDLIGHGFAAYVFGAFAAVLVASVSVLPLGILARTLALARVRAGGTDAFEPVRRWLERRPRTARAIELAVASLWAFGIAREPATGFGPGAGLALWPAVGIVGVLAAVGGAALIHRGVGSLVAPVLDGAEMPRTDVAKDEITFNAVAVTGRTRAAVAVMLALSVAAVTLALSNDRAFRDLRIVAALAAYAVVALAGAALFRNASKVAVGVDGVLVRGTSRTRFFAYRDLDAARAEGGDLELVRRDKVVLRLQLHGEDAARRAAVLERIRTAIDQVKEGRSTASAQLVSAANAAELARAAGGGADYRAAALTRDQLWALVEGPESGEDARRAAATALAQTSGPEEKARLRVAAAQCAAPEMRVALERLAAEAALEDEPGAAASLVARRAG